ncbi:MAG: hypothetical protein JXB19_05270 [Bacteroidales bacterium]|nr:hypothetical protein [Bacteroidales bacterium]
MKPYFYLIFLMALPAVFLSCSDTIEDTYIVNKPVYLTYDVLRSSIKTSGSQGIVQPGKIYFKDDYIFINEYQKGIHIIDNSDPSAPEIVQFIEIPGNVDMAVRENILYADSYIDLVAVDISDISNITEVSRVEDVFPYMVPVYNNGIAEEVDEEKGIVIGWRETEKTVEVTHSGMTYRQYPEYNTDFLVLNAGGSSGNGSGNGSVVSQSGVGGSMACFTLYDDYLYAVNNSVLHVFQVSTASDPAPVNKVYIGWDIETLFPYQDKLFIGSRTGMYIYSLEDPLNPEYISAFWHATSCDPVVVSGFFAYVTLRAGNICGDNESKLDVINIADIAKPKLVKEYNMVEPYGLGIDSNLLFVCDGDAGLKIYDASNPYELDKNQIKVYPDINAYDVIPLGDMLIMTGSNGLFQYDYSDPENISLISMIPLSQF